MNFVMAGEYGRLWWVERDNWMSTFFKAKKDEDGSRRRKKIKPVTSKAKKSAVKTKAIGKKAGVSVESEEGNVKGKAEGNGKVQERVDNTEPKKKEVKNSMATDVGQKNSSKIKESQSRTKKMKDLAETNKQPEEEKKQIQSEKEKNDQRNETEIVEEESEKDTNQ